MLAIRKKLFKNRKGFTLIELIVVIAILAILAVLAIPRFFGTLEDARYRTHNANVRTLQSAAALALAEADLGDGNSFSWNTGTDDALYTGYVELWPTIPNGTSIPEGTEYTVVVTNGNIVVSPGIYTEGTDGWTPES